jgi:signal peptidase I
MLPALRSGEWLWVGRHRPLQRGVIVLITQPDGRHYLKRLIGLPGESIEIRSGRVRIDGNIVPEPYVSETAYLEPQPDQTFQLPPAKFLVLGDSRDDSLDSRRWGPVHESAIIGVARWRLWPLLLGLFCCAIAQAADTPTRILTFVSENWLTLSVGKYDPRHGWIQGTDFYKPPEPGDTVTLFGTSGKLGELVIQDDRRANPINTPADWGARVVRGATDGQPFALAIAGSWPEVGGAVHIPLDDPDVRRIAADFLKGRRLKVEAPLITGAYRMDLDGNGQTETLLCANSDLSALRDDAEGVVYAIALLHFKRGNDEKTVTLTAKTSIKPARRSMDAHEHLNGKPEFDRLIAFPDIQGDGHHEIVVYRALDEATEIEVFTFNGKRVRKVLDAYKPGYLH